MKRSLVLVVFTVLGSAVFASAQTKLSAPARKKIIDRVTDVIKQDVNDPLINADSNRLNSQLTLDTDLDRFLQEVADALSDEAKQSADTKEVEIAAAKALVPIFEASRTDKQVGASAQSNGSTNLVSKGSVPAILGFAVENGALTKSTGGTAITFELNGTGLLGVLSGKGFIENYETARGVPLYEVLRHTTGKVTFDTNRGAADGAAANLFTGSKQQVSSFGFHVNAINKRDPRDPSYQKYWKQVGQTSLQAVANQAQVLSKAILTQKTRSDLRGWHDDFLHDVRIAGTDEPKIRTAVETALDTLERLNVISSNLDPLNALAGAVREFVQDRNALLKKVSNGSILAFDFTDERQVDNPALLNYRVVFETDLLKNGRSDFTLNASFTQFSTTDGLPGGTGKTRDYQFGAQLDVPLAANGEFENWMLTASWRYMRLLESQKIPLTTLTAPTGVVNLFQAKLTTPVKNGIKIPFAVTWSNRTELVPNHHDVRVNFGVLFDFDNLASKLKP